MTEDEAGATRSAGGWRSLAAAAWVVLVLAVWWLQVHAQGSGVYQALERAVPASRTLREGMHSMFYRPLDTRGRR